MESWHDQKSKLKRSYTKVEVYNRLVKSCYIELRSTLVSLAREPTILTPVRIATGVEMIGRDGVEVWSVGFPLFFSPRLRCS